MGRGWKLYAKETETEQLGELGGGMAGQAQPVTSCATDFSATSNPSG